MKLFRRDCEDGSSDEFLAKDKDKAVIDTLEYMEESSTTCSVSMVDDDPYDTKNENQQDSVSQSE